MANPSSNFAESPSSYISSMDYDSIDASVPVQRIIVPKLENVKKVENVANKKALMSKKTFRIGLAFTLLFIAVLIIIVSSVSNFSSSTFISKYENFNNSNFTNKDQYEDPNGGPNDYDIHYLVEQMIYKEFSPTDKKKYLDLPKVVKEQYMQDYLIQKI
jgi:hypothetical protein